MRRRASDSAQLSRRISLDVIEALVVEIVEAELSDRGGASSGGPS